MIKSILVAIDSSPYAATAKEHAVRLARLYDARVVGIHVLDVRLLEMPPYLDYTYEGIPMTPMPLEILEGFRNKGDRTLAEFREGTEGLGVQVEALMEEGVPADTIADVGETHDLIVMGKRGEHARWGKDMLGSITEAVVRRSTTPVLLTEANPVELRNVELLYDGSPAANHALKLAADIVTQAGYSLRVLTVSDDPEEGGSIQAEARAYLEAFDLAVEYRVLPGDVAMAALADLEEEPVDLVVMGLRGHSLIHRLVLGSSSEHLMRELAVPVLLVP